MKLKHILPSLFLVFYHVSILVADPASFTLGSPDKRILVKVETGKEVRYSVLFNQKLVLRPSLISLKVDGKEMPGGGKVRKATPRAVEENIFPLWGKRKSIPDRFNEMQLDFGSLVLEFRCYDDAVAYRWVARFRKDSIQVDAETLDLDFADNDKLFFPREKGDLQSSYESAYEETRLQSLNTGATCYLPLVLEKSDGLKMAVAESDLLDYPGMHLKRRAEDSASNRLDAIWASFPRKVSKGGYNNFILEVKERNSYLAKTIGKRNFPWRVLVVTPDDGKLADNDIIFKLASPQAPGDFSWVKPGKVVWDWWADWSLKGVDFKAGINTRSYKAYIDFASEHKIPYIILDEGWSDPHDLMRVKPEVDLKELAAYGQRKGVRLVLWALYHAMMARQEEAMARYSAMGYAGFKVDFFERDDQVVISDLEKMARDAARFKLVLDFHGVGKPTGLHRKYPNVLNYEGVMGNEYNKWSDKVTPEHTMILPFTRMLAGPMDFTPGGMRNTHFMDKKFPLLYNTPFVMGTRCRQLSMYVLYEAGLQMLSDYPNAYQAEPAVLEFLSAVPVSWDETRVLQAKLGQHLVMARKSGREWYLGAMNDNRDFASEVRLDFLEPGKTYKATIWKDGVNAGRNADDYTTVTGEYRAGDVIKLELCRAGGQVVRFVEK